MAAASDHRHEFRKKREMISETLFSCHHHQFMNSKDETAVLGQVLKLKQILDSSDESEPVRLVKSVNVLKLTGVGRSVNPLRNHPSKPVAEVSRTLVKEWKRMVDDMLKDNNENMQQQIKGGESIQNPRNPPQTEKQTGPTSDQPRRLIVRIKLKKDYPKGPVTPGQKVDEVLKINPVLEQKLGSKETGRKIEGVDSGNLKKQMLVDYEYDMFDESVKATGTGRSKESGLRVDSGNLKKRKIGHDEGDGIEDKFELWIKKYLEDEKMKKQQKRRVQLLSYDEQMSLLECSNQIKPPLKRQTRRRW